MNSSLSSLKSKEHIIAMIVGAVVVIPGAWAIYRSLGSIEPPTIHPQPMVLEFDIAFEGISSNDSIAPILAQRDGTVSLVMALPDQVIQEGEALFEQDREPILASVLEQQTQYQSERSVGLEGTSEFRASLDRLPSARRFAKEARENEQKAMNDVRIQKSDSEEKLAGIDKDINSFSKQLVPPMPFGNPSAGVLEDDPISDALLLTHNVLEANILSQRLALTDARVFFGVNDQTSDSLFLKSLDQPQQAVPLWEKLLETERLITLIEQRSKAPILRQDPQETIQIILASKSVTEHLLDIFEGLTELLAALDETSSLTQADRNALERLLVRNTSSMETVRETMRIHEERLLRLLEAQKQAEVDTASRRKQWSEKLARLYEERAKVLQEYTIEIGRLYTILETARSKRSVAEEELLSLEALARIVAGDNANARKDTTISDHESLNATEVIDRLQQSLNELIIRSSVGGTIQSVAVKVGDVVKKGDALLTLSTVQPLVSSRVDRQWAELLDENTLIQGRLSGRQEARLIVFRLVGKQSLDPKTTELTMRPRAGGESVTGTLPRTIPLAATLSTRETLSLPRSALLKTPDGMIAFIRSNDGAFERRPVATGVVSRNGWVQIKSGITIEDSIAADPVSLP